MSTHAGTSIHQRIQSVISSLVTSAQHPDSTSPTPLCQTDECCFIGIERNGRDTVAMQTPCPQLKPVLKEGEIEIYDTITEKLFLYYGLRRFLAFYGVRDAQEVNV